MDLKQKYQEIQEVYLSQNKPFIIGFSGGKDSTATLQLVWEALSQIKGKLNNPVYIVSVDTLVEIPTVANYLNKTLEKIKETAKQENLPFFVEKVIPDIKDSFWVNVIGKGYSAPSRKFRWCSDRLKIKPINNFIKDKISKYGEVIIVLGVRASESKNRSRSIKKRSIEDSLFLKHDTLKEALIYPVIRDWSIEDVWEYLLNNPSPFGIDNKELLQLYKQANVGDCSNCNSRFGCWVCTVVEKEKSLNALIENGEEWLKPLAEFRQFLLESSKNPELRRDVIRKGKLVKGGFTLEFRKTLLRKLIETELKVNMQLISRDEILLILSIWNKEREVKNEKIN